MWSVCDECCQFKSGVLKCVCLGGEISAKRIMLVEGCTVYKSGVRCKKNSIDGVCVECKKKSMNNVNGKYVKNIFERNEIKKR